MRSAISSFLDPHRTIQFQYVLYLFIQEKYSEEVCNNKALLICSVFLRDAHNRGVND